MSRMEMVESSRSDNDQVESVDARQGIAERLHDGPLQELVVVQLKLASLARADMSHAEEISAIASHLALAIEGLRGIVEDVSTCGVSGSDLYVQLTELCAAFRAETDIDCEFNIKPEHTRFHSHVNDVLHRTVGELLTNVRKHSRAKRVTLSSGRYDDGSIFLSVEDDGIGLGTSDRSYPSFEHRGFGLSSIDHRLSHLDASMEIDSDAGLCATIVLPARLVMDQ